MEKGADFILGSPTAMADPSIEEAMRSTAHNEEYRGHCTYLWELYGERMICKVLLIGGY